MDLAEAAQPKGARITDSLAPPERVAQPAEPEAAVAGAQRAQADTAVTVLFRARPGTAWRPVTQAAAHRYLGAPVRRVARLSALSYEVGVVDDQPAVRVMQEVSPGVLLELVQRADRAAPQAEIAGAAIGRAAAPALGDERDSLTVVVTVVDGYRVSARAPLPVDSILALLREIRP